MLALSVLLAACESKRPTPVGATAEQPSAAATQPATAASVPAAAAAPASLKVGEKAPDFELKDLDGKTMKLSSFLGKHPPG